MFLSCQYRSYRINISVALLLFSFDWQLFFFYNGLCLLQSQVCLMNIKQYLSVGIRTDIYTVVGYYAFFTMVIGDYLFISVILLYLSSYLCFQVPEMIIILLKGP